MQVRKSPQPLLSVEDKPAPRGAPWLSGRVSGQRRRWLAASESAAAEEAGRGDGKFWVERGPRGPGSRPSGRRARESPFLLSGTPPSVCVGCLPGVWILSREPSQDPATVGGSRPRADRCSRVWGRVAPRSRSPWAAGSFVPAPRCPLFLPSAGEGGGRRGGAAALTCRR